MLKIDIESIPDEKQRYNTVGDYQEGKHHKLNIRVSEMDDWRYELLIALHELVEASLCRKRGITNDAIDAFDTVYEDTRKEGDMSEPGDSKEAPYYKEHQFANIIEKMIADELEVDWEDYAKKVEALNKQ